MNKEFIVEELEKARLAKGDLQLNRAAVRGALAEVVAREGAERHVTWRSLFPIGVTAGFAFGVAFMMLIRLSEEREVVNNLGSAWYTYIDTTDSDAFIWPPNSTGQQNNFVKSAPGYGDHGYAVRFKGKVGKQSHEGYMGVAAFLGAGCLGSRCDGVNIRRFEKIRFKMKGRLSGGELVLVISNGEAVEGQGGASRPSTPAYAYEARITELVADEWQTVTLDLREDFRSPSKSAGSALVDIDTVLADARQVKWHVQNGKRAVADVWIDELEFF